MSNINYTLGKDFVTFSALGDGVSYYLQSWSGLGMSITSVATASPFGTIYNPGESVVFNTFSAIFIIDEDWKVYETLNKLATANSPIGANNYEQSLTNIDLHLMNNTYQREVGVIHLYNGYIQDLVNVENSYNLEDNTMTKTVNAIIKYQYHEFVRNAEAKI